MPIPELVVALDSMSIKKAEELMTELEGLPVLYKIGMDLFLASGPDWIHSLACSGKRIFLDLKFHDIPSTVGQSVMKAAELKVEFLSLHLSGGTDMLAEAGLRLQQAFITNQIIKKPKILGISVLSSFHEEDWNQTIQKFTTRSAVKPIEDSVLAFSTFAVKNPNVDGLICSSHELSAIRAAHPDLYLMVSGIRPMGCFKHDQQWIMTPNEALISGASAIIVGRSIIQAEDSRVMTESILRELGVLAFVAA